MLISRRDHPTVLSVFTGAGGMDVGLEAAGFHSVGCIELNSDARETLAKNRPSWRLLEPRDVVAFRDTATLSDIGLAMGELDLLAGGPPCQPFSLAGQWTSSGRNGLKDERYGPAIGAFLDLIAAFRPRAVLLENVPGFVSGPASAFEYLQERIRAMSSSEWGTYSVEYRVLDAADFGVPQHRRRAMVVLLRTGGTFDWPQPTHQKRSVRSWDALFDLSSANSPIATGRWAELLPSIPEGKNYQWHTDHGGGLPLFGYRTRYWSFLLKLAKDQPAWTLPASPGPSTGPFHWDNRPLTPEEKLRLQSFPRSWRLVGSDRSRSRQAGNATPPLLAEMIGRQLFATLMRSKPAFSPRLRIARRRELPPPAEVFDVGAAYLDLAGVHAAHPGTGEGPHPRGG